MPTTKSLAIALFGLAAVGIAAPHPEITQAPQADFNSIYPYFGINPPAVVPAATLSGQDVTFFLYNGLDGTPTMTMGYGYNAGGVGPRGNPEGTFTSSTSMVVPTSWAGRFNIQKAAPTPINYNVGSLIEGNYAAGAMWFDVSYVAGFSVAITCGCGPPGSGDMVTGCNVPLFQENSCPNQIGDAAFPLCPNPAGTNGPPSAFFAPCKGAAFTYPDDWNANTQCYTNEIHCCLGVNCSPDPKQT